MFDYTMSLISDMRQANKKNLIHLIALIDRNKSSFAAFQISFTFTAVRIDFCISCKHFFSPESVWLNFNDLFFRIGKKF